MTAFVTTELAREVAERVYSGLTSIPLGWQIDTSFGTVGQSTSDSGAYVYALKPLDPNDTRRILAFRGTEVSLTNLNDVYADVTNIGRDQFGDLRDDVNSWLAQQLVDGNRVELVGHSLGGALVQWAINDTNKAAVTNVVIDPETGLRATAAQFANQLHFTTLNAPGITHVLGGSTPLTDRSSVVVGEHHVVIGSTPYVTGDPIHLLGGPPVGGTVIGHRVDFATLGERGLFAHDINKTDYWDLSQSPIVSYAPPYLDVGVAQSYATHFSQLGNTDGTVTGDFEAVARLGLFLVASGVALGANTVALAAELRGLSFDREIFATTIASPVNGINQGLAMILEAAEAAGQNVASLSVRLVDGVIDMLQGIGPVAGQVSDFVSNILVPFLLDTANGISNAVTDFLRDIPGTLVNLTNTISSLADIRLIDQAYAGALSDLQLSSSVRDAVEEARETVQLAGQTVVISTGMGSNPFRTPGYMPGGASSATVDERLGEVFRLSLPFAAGAGGQRVSLQLQGPQANQLSVVTDEGVQMVGTNGTVEVRVPEGADQVLFTLTASDDISNDATVTLSSTLVDATGAPTHMTQVESVVSLKAFVGNTDDIYEEYVEDWSWVTDQGPGVSMGAGGYIHQTLIGGAGDDSAVPFTDAHGDDTIYGNGGSDVLSSGRGHDVLYGGEGNDFLRGDHVDDVVDSPWTGPGSDPRGTQDGTDYVDGGAGNDKIGGGGGDDRLIGGTGDDQLWGDAYTNGYVIQHQDGSATLVSMTGVLNPGNDVLEGGDGNDLLSGDGGDDTLDGGAGDDLLVGDTQQGQDLIYSMAPGDDYLVGGTGNDELQGNSGHDVLLGGAGNDLLFGDDEGVDFSQEGDDWLDGGDGADQLVGQGGHDTLLGGTGADLFSGGAGNDTLVGGEDDDVGLGGEGNDEMVAGAGADQFDGEAGDDVLFGDDGNDLLIGGQGVDELDGGADNDLLLGGADNDTQFGREGNDELQGNAGDDLLAGDAGDDRIFGQEGNDELFGGDGNDGLRGDDGDDVIDGGIGDDVLVGDADGQIGGSGGNDFLTGGTGNDVLVGGGGQDTYLFDLGDGFDLIVEAVGEGNRLAFGAGINPAAIIAAVGPNDSLVIRIGNGDEAVQIESFGINNLNGLHPIDSFQFSDGTILTYSQLAAGGLGISVGFGTSQAQGTAQGEKIYGGGGYDVVHAGAGNDVVLGGTGNDALFGGDGDDVLYGGVGNDVLYGELGADMIYGEAGNDSLYAGSRATSGGGEGDGGGGEGGGGGEFFAFGQPADQLYGNDGDDYLNSGNEYFETSNTMLVGGGGDDTFVIDSLADSVIEGINGGIDTVETFISYSLPDNVENLRLAAIPGLVGVGNALDNVMRGSGQGMVDGGAGNDTLIDAEFYRFGRGYGRDVILEQDTSSAPYFPGGRQDIIQMAADLAPTNVSWHRSGNDLILTINGTTEQLTIPSFYTVAFTQGMYRFSPNLYDPGITINGSGVAYYVASSQIEGVQFADGTIWGVGTFDATQLGAYWGNTYTFGRGDGVDAIVDFDFTAEQTADVLQMRVGVLPGDVTITRVGDDLVLGLTGTTDQLTIESYFASVAVYSSFGGTGQNVNAYQLELIQFADGTVWDTTAIANMVPIVGTELNDFLRGTSHDNVILGLGGRDTLLGLQGDDQIDGGPDNDYIEGHDGNDLLDAGTGTDTLIGGAGDDTYRVNLGDGIDTIWDESLPSEGNRIQFGVGITQGDLTFRHDEEARTLTIQVGNSGLDQLVLPSFNPTGSNGSLVVERLTFTDGSTINLVDLFPPLTNHAPTVVIPLADRTVSEGAPFNIQIPATAFADSDPGDVLTLSASLVDGTSLPAWFAFDAATLTFSGAPDDAQAGSLDVKVTATDTGNLTVSDVFTLTVTNVNEAPTVATPMTDQQATEDVALSFSVPLMTFTDVDQLHGDQLVYSASLTGRGSLPSWLSFDPMTRTFSGTPLNTDVGTLNLTVMATDLADLNVADSFLLTVQNVNDTPVVQTSLVDQTAAEDSPFFFTIPGTTFTDEDTVHGDELTYGATYADGSPLPTWLRFDPTTRTFSGTPGIGDAGVLRVAVTATDTQEVGITNQFTLTVSGPLPQTVVGTAGDDGLTGGRGDDTLDGGAGNDALSGGSGDDTYLFSLGDGVDTIHDTSFPGEGNTIQFGTGIMPDDLSLGIGSFLVRVGTNGDALHLTPFDPNNALGAHAIETFRFADGTTLNYSQLVARGFDLTGTTGNDSINGTNMVDRIRGLAGNDTLNGGSGDDVLDGGTGADTMRGGVGDDTYIIDSSSDLVIEAANEGTDTAQSSMTYTLGNNVEHLTLNGTGVINGTGNTLDNIMIGNNANNTLTGGAGNDRLNGEFGNDTMVGGIGDDTYVVNQTGDVVTESSNQGTDTVESSLTYMLGGNVENLTLTGTAAINGTGNSANNVLVGNSGNNTLDGGSGNDMADGRSGDDHLLGGSGDDQLLGGLGNDALSGGSGNDVLHGGDGIDALDGGSGDDQLLSGAGNDTLTGGSGADQFTSGAGNDMMTGGSGNDVYNFLRGDGQDTIIDSDPFSSNQDRAIFDETINPLDLVISRQANNLRLVIHDSSDQVTVENWYLGAANRIESIQAGNGQTLLSTQVDQLIQAMAGFTQQTGLTWDQAIDQRAQDVQAVLAASWQ